jgi:hypothetical protein
MRAKESLKRNLMWLSEQLLELVNVFKEASRNFIIEFSRAYKEYKQCWLANRFCNAV